MNTNRRQFMMLSFGAGSALALTARPWFHEAQAGAVDGTLSSSPTADGKWTATRKSWALGSHVAMTAIHPREAIAKKAINAAFDELKLVESLMSIYRPDSQLSELNRTSTLDKPHKYFVDVLTTAAEMSRLSHGAFDITVQPLWSLFSMAKKESKLPSDEAIAAAKKKVDWRRVELSEKRVVLRDEGTAITLNGIAQGYAADRASAALRSFGVEHAMIDTGEFSTIGNKADEKPWTIGIQHPRRKDAFISIAKLNGRCLATSGDYATAFSDDFRFNHLFDPRTGRSPDELASVSIAATSAMQADALSTATFVLGVERGMKLIKETPAADAMMVLKNGKTFVTKNFPVVA